MGGGCFLTPSEKSAVGDSFPCLSRPASLSPARLLHASWLAYINCSSLGVYKSISRESIFIKTLIWLHPLPLSSTQKPKSYTFQRWPLLAQICGGWWTDWGLGNWVTGVGVSWIWMWIAGQTFVLVTAVTGGRGGCPFSWTQEFYRHSLKGFAALHGLIYRAFGEYWDFKDTIFSPLICWWCSYTPKRTRGFNVLGGSAEGKTRSGKRGFLFWSGWLWYWAWHLISHTFINKLWALHLRFGNWEDERGLYTPFSQPPPTWIPYQKNGEHGDPKKIFNFFS